MNLAELSHRLDDELRTNDFAEIDGSPNGLQVGPSECVVDRVAFAVDAVAATIEDAADWEADLLVTHHGLWWEHTERLTGRTFDRVASLLNGELALYVSHLPLDAHQELGNAAGVADVLELDTRSPFGELRGEHLGQCGHLPEPVGFSGVVDQLAEHSSGGQLTAMGFGSDEVEDVAIVTGSGADWLDEAVDVGADVLVTGEGKHSLYHQAREAGMNVVLAGHYATETFGVKSLQGLVEEWGLETTFLDHPTGL